MYEINEKHSPVTSIFDTNFRSDLEAAIALRKKESWESSQAMLAMLMAAENLRIVFDANLKAPAHIDLVRRIIRVARLVSGQEHLIRGLLVHEVGHALFTKGNEPIDQVLNIVEDGYIERMISKRYPGGKKHLRAVFDHFFNEGFVGEFCGDGMGDLVTRSLNTLNYNCKGIKFGKRLPYPSDLPRETIEFFEQEVELCVLPELKDRKVLAIKVKRLLKDFREKDSSEHVPGLPETGPQEDPRQEADDYQDEDGDGYGGNGIDWNEGAEDKDENCGTPDPNDSEDEDEKLNPEETDDDGKTARPDRSDSEANNRPAAEKNEDLDEDEIENEEEPEGIMPGAAGSGDDTEKEMSDSEIEEWWKQNIKEDRIFDHHEGFETEGDAKGEGARISLEVAPPEAVFDLGEKLDITDIPALKNALFDEDLVRAEKAYQEMLEEAKYTARAMYQKFLLERNALEAQKVSHQKTGSLDISRLSQHKITDDIFKTRRVMPTGVSHGAVVVLDWSGSMDSKQTDLWFRAAEFVEFAHLSGVEVLVYAFTTMGYDGTPRAVKNNHPDYFITHGTFIRIIDTVNCTRLENIERLKRFWTLIQLNQGYDMGWRKALREGARADKFGMGGTNILEAHAFAQYLARGLKTDRKNILVVSDGSDNHGWSSNTVGPDGVFNPDDPENPITDLHKASVSMDGRDLTDWMVRDPSLTGWKSKDEALYRQVKKFAAEGVKTTGIYIGYLSENKERFQKKAYHERFVVWPDWNGKGGKRARVKDNAFIGQLVKLISA